MKVKRREIKFTDWEIFGSDHKKLMALLNKSARDIANIYLKDIEVEFSATFCRDPVSDPLTILLVNYEVEEDVINSVLAEISLSDVITKIIKECELDGSYARQLNDMSVRMKKLANRIDKACKKQGYGDDSLK